MRWPSWGSDPLKRRGKNSASDTKAGGFPSPRLSSRRAYDGKVISVDVDTVRFPDGTTGEIEMVSHPGAAAIVALSEADSAKPRVLLLRQYRYAADGFLLEIPAGRLDAGESSLECARPELREETGYRALNWKSILTMYTTPGFTDERIHLFLASELSAGEAAVERDEFLEVEMVPFASAIEMISAGEIQDAKTIAGLLVVSKLLMRGQP